MSSAPLLGCRASDGGGGGQQRRPPHGVPALCSPWLGRVVDTEEAWAQLQFAVPMVLTNMFYYGIPLVSVMFSGHLGDVQLAGATLGNSWATVTGYALVTGMSGALETLCGQAYGAGLHRKLGLYLQSSLLLSAAVSALVSVLWMFTEPVLLLLRQDPEVSRAAAAFVAPQVPGLFAFGFLQCLLRYLQTQSAVAPLVACSAAPFALHVALAYLLVHVLGLGLAGAAAAISATFAVSCLMLLAYVLRSEAFGETWKGFSAEALGYVLPTAKLAAPSAVMVCLEIWAFELLVLVAGLLPNSTVSTSLIAMCTSTEAIAFMITYGFSAAVSTRVSNEIGAGNVDKAKNAVRTTLKLSVLLGVSFVLLLAFGHDLWASLFSGSAVIVAEFAAFTPLMIISIVLDSAQGVLSGVSRGCGWQHLAALTNLVAYYLVAMPLAILFAFKLKFNAKGLWMGLICGLTCQGCSLVVITVRTKWSKIAAETQHTAQNIQPRSNISHFFRFKLIAMASISKFLGALACLLALSLLAATASAAEKETRLRVFWHDVVSGGPNVSTVAQVAEGPSSNSSATGFGSVTVIDDPLTEGPNLTSKLLGRAQGMYVSAGKDSLSLMMAMSFVFVDGAHNGSSLAIMGPNAAARKVREMAVVGGTGVFRFARGYCQATTWWFDANTGDATVEYNIHVRHD